MKRFIVKDKVNKIIKDCYSYKEASCFLMMNNRYDWIIIDTWNK